MRSNASEAEIRKSKSEDIGVSDTPVKPIFDDHGYLSSFSDENDDVEVIE